MKTEQEPRWPLLKNLLYIIAYVLWLVNILVCFAAVIQILSAVNVLWVLLKGNRYTLSFINQIVLLLSSLGAFVYVVFLEGYYRASLSSHSVVKNTSANIQPQPISIRLAYWWIKTGPGTLLRRFIITTAIPLLIFILSLAIAEFALNHIFS